MMNIRILLVEDEENILAGLKMNLELEGYEVVTAKDGLSALQSYRGQHFNLIILDVMLPEVNGLQVCEQIRLDNSDIPILMLTAKDSTQDKINGLQKGADDYLTKPFDLQEFLLRVKVLIKHSLKGTKNRQALSTYQFGVNQINFATFEADCHQGAIHLTKKEAKLLKLLIDRKDEVVSREQILHSVWGYDVFPSTRTIDNFILSFRKYFENDPKKPQHFHSIRGVGYKFTAA